MHNLQFKELNDSFLINSANGPGPRSDENRASDTEPDSAGSERM